MSDLISRSRLIEEIKENHWGWFSREMLLLMLENQPAVTDTNVGNKWISCSERLPDDYEIVNITWVNRNPEPYYKSIKDKPFTGTAIYHYGKWYWYSCVCEDYLAECGDSTCDRMDKDIEVIAWMPLPEPYKGE